MHLMGVVVRRVVKDNSTTVLRNWMNAIYRGEEVVLGEKLRVHFWKREDVMDAVAYCI